MHLLPCPFCGSKPFWSLGKKLHCQLHGEPMQAVVLTCRSGFCPAKPRVEGGDIYNGGEAQAREKVAALWNRRHNAPRGASPQEIAECDCITPGQCSMTGCVAGIAS